jgi:hypothetical protein
MVCGGVGGYMTLLLGKLILAICFVESGGDTLALNYKDGKGHNNHSFGYCQVTYQTALELGMPEHDSCKTDLRPRFKRTVSACPLFDKKVNVHYASLYLKKQLKRYNNDLLKTISAYNAGSFISKNKDYVNKVLRRLDHAKSHINK